MVSSGNVPHVYYVLTMIMNRIYRIRAEMDNRVIRFCSRMYALLLREKRDENNL